MLKTEEQGLLQLKESLKTLTRKYKCTAPDLNLLQKARQLTIDSFWFYTRSNKKETKGQLRNLNKRIAYLARNIEASLSKTSLLNELFLKDNPDAAWVLASKLKNSLGNVEEWAKSDWNQYITLLKQGAKGDLIPALTSKSYIVAKAFENSPYGNTGDAINYYERAWNEERDGDAATALGMIFADEYSDFYDLEKAISYPKSRH